MQHTEKSDSIASADPIELMANWKPERPTLIHPSVLSDYRMLAATEETRNLGNFLIDTLGVRLKTIKSDIQAISNEHIQKLKEAAERAQSSDWWSVLKKIATCLLSAVSLVFGIALVGTGGGALIGGAMIASGVLSLANFALSETGSWDWISKALSNDNEELQKNLKMILPAAFGVLAAGMGIVGSGYSLATGAVQFAEKAAFIAQTALSIFNSVTIFGKGQADAQLLWTQADLTSIQGHLTAARTKFDSTMHEIEGCLKDISAFKSKAKKAVQMLANSNIQTVR